VAIVSRRAESSGAGAAAIQAEGGQAIGIPCDVNDRAGLERVLEQVSSAFGPVDILVNGAGGKRPGAVTSPNLSFFDLDSQAIDEVFGLNFTGTLKCCQVFGRDMAERGQGCIINIASMTSLRPLTRTVAYGAAKAAVVNFTQWLAVHMAQEYSVQIRVKTHLAI
jgi:NAD(P)-dependent dehydrogenase (short-subunit alcohol dehydrogenase family)